MGIHAVVGLNLRTGDALLSVKAGVLSATQDLFDEEIVPTAKELSPVTAEGYQRNVAEKKKHPSGTGTNRRSIDSTVTETAEGVQAQLFTQSGYGGYLELGTSKMRAQPYLNPAFEMHIGKLSEKVKEKLGG
jgi:HK97 gp10 family phage protein